MKFGNTIAEMYERSFNLWENVKHKSLFPLRKIIICTEKMRRRADDGTEIMPATVFFKELWAGSLIH